MNSLARNYDRYIALGRFYAKTKAVVLHGYLGCDYVAVGIVYAVTDYLLWDFSQQQVVICMAQIFVVVIENKRSVFGKSFN